MKRPIILALVGLALASASGFMIDYHLRHREAALVARANEYWTAIQLHDLLTAYYLEAETAAGLLQPHEVETDRFWGLRLVNFTLGSISYFGDRAEIEVSREMTYPDTQLGKTRNKPPIRDVWSFYKGRWYHGLPEKDGSGIHR